MLQLRAAPADDRGQQAVLDGEYALPADFDPGSNPAVLDIGANVGSYSLYARHEYPGATIHAYEPVPDNYKLLEQNVEGLNILVHKTAVWLATGKTRIFAPKEGFPNGSYSLKDTTAEVDVSKGGMCNVMHAADLPPADILKVDTEGCELDILKNYPYLDKVKAVVLEYHTHQDRMALRNLLAAAGLGLIDDKETHPRGVGIQKYIRPVFPTLFVGVLAGGGKTWGEFETCLAELQRYAPLNGVNLIVVKESGTGVDRARNRLVATALENKAVTHFMFFDDDITFKPEWVINMVKSGLDVVGAGYPRKQIDWEQVAKAVKDGVPAEELPYYSTSFIFNHVPNNDGGNNGRHIEGVGDFVEVEEIGTGFLMVRREVLEKLIDAYRDEVAYITDYPPRDEVHHMVFACQRDPNCELERAKRALLQAAKQVDVAVLCAAAGEYRAALLKGKEALGRYTTEDYSACRLWRMLGGKVFMYLQAAVGHYGVMKYEGQVARMFKKEPSLE